MHSPTRKARLTRLLTHAATFTRNRFSPSKYLGLHFTIGILAIALGIWAFAEIADAVHENDDIASVDAGLSNWLHANATPRLTALMLGLTIFGDPLLVLPVGLILAAAFWFNNQHHRALFLFLSVAGGLLLNTALKLVFVRARPMFEDPIAFARGYSFPSGHVSGATLLYAALALILVRTARTWPARLVPIAMAALLIATVSFTRIYLGVHYLTDVLAAQAIALAWLALAATSIHTLRRRHVLRSEPASI